MSYTEVAKGALFKNDKQNDRQPDYTGKGELPDGTEVRLSAWLKKSQNGKTYMSVSVQKKDAEQVDDFGGSSNDDSEIPW